MNQRREIETGLSKFMVPSPGELVRNRALAAGREASRHRAAPDVWERIWSSTPFRLAWTAAVIALAAGHLMLPRGSRESSAAPRYVERMLGAEANDELVAGLLPPPLDRATAAEWGSLANENDDNGEM